jgi:hypothetical protein
MSQETILRSNQVSHIDATPVMGNVADEMLENILLDVDLNFSSPLRIYAAATPDAKLYIEPNHILSSDGAEKSTPPVKKQIDTFVASTINFQTGVTTGGTIDITIPSGTTGYYRRVGFTLISGGILKAIFADEAATLAAVANPGTLFLSGGVQIGWVDLQCTVATAYKTAGSATNVIENSVSGSATIHRIAAGGGVGSGSGATGGLRPASGFNAIFTDDFSEFPNSAATKVRDLETNAAFDVSREMYVLKCDKTRTVTTVGVNFTLSAAPTYGAAIGDIIYASGAWRRILTISGTTGTLDAAFATNLTAAACMVSQAVWSVDIVNFGDVAQKTRLRDFFPSATLNQINISYDDSVTSNDDVADYVDAARIVVSASNDGLQTDTALPLSNTFASYFERPQAPSQINNYILLSNTNKQRLFLCFFCSPTNGSVTTLANALGYQCSLEEKQVLQNGGILWSSVCWSDSSVTPINCSNPVLTLGKSRIQFSSPYVVGIGGPGAGELTVTIGDNVIPRFYTGVKGAYYIEIDPWTIDLWTDVSGAAPEMDIRAVRRNGSFDVSAVNSNKFAAIYDAVVGSVAQVGAGIATYTSINTAISNVTTGGTILVLRGTYTENVAVSKEVHISGQGHSTVVSGTFTFNSATSYASAKMMKITGTLLFNTTSVGNIVKDFWQTSGGVVADTGTDNLYDVRDG